MGLSLVAFNWSWIDAHARAAVVISTALEAPVVTSAVEAATGEPRLTDVSVAGNPTLVAHPGGEGPWPALFFVNGFVSEGRELPQVRRLAEGLARAGYLVVVPDLPGLRRGEISPRAARRDRAGGPLRGGASGCAGWSGRPYRSLGRGNAGALGGRGP